MRIGVGLFIVMLYASSMFVFSKLLKEEDEEEDEEEEEEEEEEEVEGMWTTFVSMAFGTDYGIQPEPESSATQTPATV